MKRILICSSFVAIILVLTIANAFGETFSYRGIDFNMTSSEIKATETLTLKKGNNPNSFLTYQGTVDGEKNTTVEYQFKNGKLNDIWVNYEGTATKSKVGPSFTTINESLKAKYGKPLGYTNGNCDSFIGSAFETNIKMGIYLAETLNKSYQYDYDEWRLDTDDGIVKIDHMYFYSPGVKGPVCNHVLQFTIFR